MADLVTVVEFLKPGGLFQTGERAGFDPDLANEYVKRGFARIISSSVPRVDPTVRANDAMRQLDSVRAMLAGSARDLDAAKAAGAESAEIADAQAQVGMAMTLLKRLEKEMGAGARPDEAREPRRPTAASRAA